MFLIFFYIKHVLMFFLLSSVFCQNLIYAYVGSFHDNRVK